MTTFRGHYMPVEARREVLRIYRDRRTHGAVEEGLPLDPLRAMRATVQYFEGWLAHAVTFGPVGRQDVETLTHQYRAAQFYLDRMYLRIPGRWATPPVRTPRPRHLHAV